MSDKVKILIFGALLVAAIIVVVYFIKPKTSGSAANLSKHDMGFIGPIRIAERVCSPANRVNAENSLGIDCKLWDEFDALRMK